MEEIIYKPIGMIRSPYTDVEGMPIQPAGATGVKGSVEINADLAPGLKDLEGFSYIILVYHFHLSEGFSLEPIPFLDTTPRGLFATRAPRRPNPIGVSVVKLTGISGTILSIEDVDVIDGTPLLDIKPFVPVLDNRETDRVGWFKDAAQSASEARADKRFAKQSA
jgi:tRNA-Thr(GGU) m(6)t(6)A37 methyltransferase TsaA